MHDSFSFPSRWSAALFAPRSIAVVGASDDSSKTAGRPVPFLRKFGFDGTIYPINPTRPTVQGERAYSCIEALPQIPEHAYILVPTEGVIASVEACGAAGVAVATVLASGFSESGAEGLAREHRLREISQRTGIRILGPSSLGVVNVRQRLMLTANAAFAEPDLPAGNIFVASHSGSLMGALVARGKERGIGFAGLVSVGNEVDLGIGEICMATLDDPQVGGYLLFLETIRKSRELRDFALAAAARGKPVIVYKLGRSSVAAELAMSHTGALAGEDDVADAFLRDSGIARVDTLEGLIETLPLLKRVGPRRRYSRPRTVGVVTTTGGGAAMVVDQLGVRGVTVQGPSGDTHARLSAAGVKVAHGRIVDLTLAGTRYKVMKAALDVMSSAPEFDLVLAVAGSSARYQPQLAVRPIIDSVGEKPIAAFIVPEAREALAQLTKAGVPNFRTPEACADGIAAALLRRSPRPLPVLKHPDGNGRLLDELDAYTVLDRLGIPRAQSWELSVTETLGAPDVRFPAVAKVLSAGIVHKTEVGGVVLGIRDVQGLARAIAQIRASVAEKRPGTPVHRVLVQPMIQGIGEVLIGYRVDAQVGPLVMLAAGGVLTEIYRDRSLRLAPVDLETAREMISEVRALEALAGYRGRPAGDLEAVARALVALSQLATSADLDVVEAEINPVLVLAEGEGVVAVDAVIRLA